MKQVLINTAKPMPRFKPQDVGTKFKSPALVDAQFGHFGVGQPEAMVLKVIRGRNTKGKQIKYASMGAGGGVAGASAFSQPRLIVSAAR